MARELVNLSTENEKLKEQTKNYPILHEEYKVNRSSIRENHVFNCLIP